MTAFTAPPLATSQQSYFANVGQAFRALFAAVLGLQTVQVVSNYAHDAVENFVAPYESAMPDLASELRYMAARAN
jgi:hypothetical protein